jgi:nicotinate-nucleotide pyrophosphorylase (carboxylating)
MREQDYGPLIERALSEDLGQEGDVTSAVLPDRPAQARLVSKEEGVLAGSSVFAAVFGRVDPLVKVRFLRRDGEPVHPGEPVAHVDGPVRSILSAERTALNFLCYLSGIATETRRFVETAGGKVAILDTRKTLPGYRGLAKAAVRAGGGMNHRMGLYDMVLIKDNHIDSAGSLSKAVALARRRWGERFPIQVECRTQAEVREAVSAGVQLIMLDNMSPRRMRRAVQAVGGRAQIEASGNMTLRRVRALRELGLDRISVGRLTHSVRALDFSLDIVEWRERP